MGCRGGKKKQTFVPVGPRKIEMGGGKTRSKRPKNLIKEPSILTFGGTICWTFKDWEFICLLILKFFFPPIPNGVGGHSREKGN